MATVRLGKDPRTMKRIFERSGIKPDGHFDARTPVYLVANVDKMMRDRIGRGAPGVPKPKRTGQDAAA